MLNKNILEQANLSSERIQELDHIFLQLKKCKSKPLHSIPHIVCTGIYNAGKSTLLNAILDVQHFPTGDIPTTKSVASYDAGYSVYLDTPGLNANDVDDTETTQAYRSADITLFVSNAQNGGITKAESQWLQTLKDDYGTQERFEQRFLYVLTQCGQIEESRRPVVVDKFREDFQRALGFPLHQIIQVDAHAWEDGVAQNEDLLKNYSNIPELKNILEAQSHLVSHTIIEQHEADIQMKQAEAYTLLKDIKRELAESMQRSGSKLSDIVNTLFSDHEAGIFSAGKLGDVYLYESIDRNFDCYRLEDKSESSCRRRARDKAKSLTNSYTNQVYRKLKDLSRKYPEYGNTGMNSVYFKAQDKVNQKSEALVSELAKMDIPMVPQSEIMVEPHLWEVSSGELYEAAQDYCDLRKSGAWDLYVEIYDVSCDEMGYYKEGLFGGWRPMYSVYFSAIEDEIYEHAQSEMKSSWEAIERRLNSAVKSFNDKMKAAITDRLQQMKASALESAKQTEEAEQIPYIQAISHLTQLEEEIK